MQFDKSLPLVFLVYVLSWAKKSGLKNQSLCFAGAKGKEPQQINKSTNQQI
jgi:hypothetical protein